jgi:GNAT superfamily N-acetyltransferase
VSAPFLIRPARPDDGAAMVRLVNGLAAFEKLPGPDDAAALRLVADAFGPSPPFEVLVAEVDGQVRGHALFFFGYSTFRAARVLWLEDLFVDPEVRGRGIGRALMLATARTAVARGCCRFEWSVLDWNENAQRFYKSLGATILGEWLVCRVDGEALARLGAPA